jgi:hypothetical protein
VTGKSSSDRILIPEMGTLRLNQNTRYYKQSMKNLTNFISRGFANAIVLGIATTTMGAIESRPANAANLSFTGNFTDPNNAPSFSFTADGISTVTIQSSSWGTGGFDLNLSLFDGAGNWQDERDDDIGLDFQYTGVLAAGTYQAVITAFGNSPNGSFPGGNLSDGFTNGGDFFGRTSAYAFEILNVNNTTPTSVPEPSDLIGTVLGGFSVVMLKRKLAASRKANHKSSF